MKRRQFLQLSAASLGAFAMDARLFAAERGGPRLLVVFLRGGYDCANALVPYSSPFYYESRPNIAIARPDANDPKSAMRLDRDWALAPALRGTIGAMYERGELAFVPFAGTDDLSRSHFETQDRIESGQAKGAAASHSGFLARLAAATSAAPIAFTDALPLAMQGSAGVPNVSIRGTARGGFDQQQSDAVASMYRGHALESSVNEGIALRREIAADDDPAMRAANRGAANARGLDRRVARIAKLMRDEYQVGFMDVGGWDTHVNQGGAQGALADNLGNLGTALDAFARELGERAWKETTVAVISEFGRTFRENGNRGTDHGHGTTFWLLGGAVRGGRIAGEQVKVERGKLLQDRDFVVLNDYRAVLGGVFKRLWDLPQSRLDAVFPQANPLDIGLV